MKNFLFIAQMYVSRVLIATLLAYAYLTNSSPSHEGRLEKSSPAFFADELETADGADDLESIDEQDVREANQE